MRKLVYLICFAAVLAQCRPAPAQGAYCVFERTIAHNPFNEVATRNDWLRIDPCGEPAADFHLWRGNQRPNMTIGEAQALYDYILVNDGFATGMRPGWFGKSCCTLYTIWKQIDTGQLMVVHDGVGTARWQLYDSRPKCCENAVQQAFNESNGPPLLPSDCRQNRLYNGVTVVITDQGAFVNGVPYTLAPPSPNGPQPDVNLNGDWQDDRGTVYRLTQNGNKVTGTGRGSACSGHPNMTATLDGTMHGHDFTGTFLNREGAVWSGGPAMFTITPDGRLVGHGPGTLHWGNNESRPLDVQFNLKRGSTPTCGGTTPPQPPGRYPRWQGHFVNFCLTSPPTREKCGDPAADEYCRLTGHPNGAVPGQSDFGAFNVDPADSSITLGDGKITQGGNAAIFLRITCKP